MYTRTYANRHLTLQRPPLDNDNGQKNKPPKPKITPLFVILFKHFVIGRTINFGKMTKFSYFILICGVGLNCIAPLPLHNGHLSTKASKVCPQSDLSREF